MFTDPDPKLSCFLCPYATLAELLCLVITRKNNILLCLKETIDYWFQFKLRIFFKFEIASKKWILLIFLYILFSLQMIQTIRTLVENADSLYEKIVQCQKAGKCTLSLKTIIKNSWYFSLVPKTLEFIYSAIANISTHIYVYEFTVVYSNSEKDISNNRNQKAVKLQLIFSSVRWICSGSVDLLLTILSV